MKHDIKETLACWFAVCVIFTGIMFLFTGNVDSVKGVNALNAQGISNVTLTGYKFFGCASGEYYSTGFKGIGVNGKPVSGVICSGFLKGVTVRYD